MEYFIVYYCFPFFLFGIQHNGVGYVIPYVTNRIKSCNLHSGTVCDINIAS